MADITLPTTALPGNKAVAISAYSNSALAQGQIVYNGTNRKVALSNSSLNSTAIAIGMAQQTVTANTPLRVQTQGRIKGLSGLAPGIVYYVSDSVPGAICLFDDLVTASRVVIVGVAISATELELLVKDTGYTKT